MRRFEIYPCGDPYSRAWDCSEVVPGGCVYRGDISSVYRKAGLVRYLRRAYPGCKIRVRG